MNIQHPDYAHYAPLWVKVRDLIAGEEAVKAKTTTYLPRLSSQTDASQYASESYANYIMRADFYGACSRTVQGLVGAVLSKEPALEGIDEQDEQDITDALGLSYEGSDSLAMEQIQEAVSVGRYALLVDKGEEDTKPYVVLFHAEDVIHWATDMIQGRDQLTKILVRQVIEEPDNTDPLGIRTKQVNQVLVLCLGDVPEKWASVPGFEGFMSKTGEEPCYWQEIWREVEDETTREKTYGDRPSEIRVPTKRGGRYWQEIPCDIVNAITGIKAKPETPPMLALANKCLAWYRDSADLQYGRHMTAIPQPYLTGYTPQDEGERLVMGCGYAWALPDPASSVGFLEFSGAGLANISEGMQSKKADAAVLGARMLEEQPNGVEALGTVKLRQAGDRSVLKTIAKNVSEAMTRAIQRYLSWEYPRYESTESLNEVSYELACDFDASRMDPAELAAMTTALQEGSMSWDTFAFNMRRGEMLPPGVTDEEERERIQMGAPGRSRKDEAAMLQGDVREGRISTMTYLESLERLGYLAGVDIAAEPDKVFEDKAKAAEVQMLAFQQAGGGFGGGAPAAPFGDGVEDETDEPEEDPPADDEDEEDATQ